LVCYCHENHDVNKDAGVGKITVGELLKEEEEDIMIF
jgi:hypothetical protein